MERFEGLCLEVVDEITKTYHRVSQKDNVHMESDAVVLERDLRTGERVNIANVMINEDLMFMNDDNEGSTFVLDTVSYTHLDVYKRQVIVGLWLT